MENLKKGKRLSFFGKTLVFINLIFVFALLMAYLANYVSPSKFWILALFGMFYQLILFGNLIFAVYWIIRWKWVAFLSIAAIFIGYSYIGRLYQLNLFGKEQNNKSKNPLNILSYNVRNFDIYNYKKNWQYNYENRNKILHFLKEQKPDIFCFQEFVYDNTNQFNTLDTILQIQGAKHHHVAYNVVSRNQIYFGIATFSKYPIINTAKILFPNSKTNFAIYSDVVLSNDTIRIFNIHLESLHLGKEEYKLAKELEDIKIKDNSKLKKGSKRIMQQLKKAYIKRAEQADIIAQNIQQSPHPVVVCGDFNDTPCSYVYSRIVKNLYDAYKVSGRGFGRSYNGFDLYFRIDYILHSKKLKSSGFKTIPVQYSDHFPVVCKIEI